MSSEKGSSQALSAISRGAIVTFATIAIGKIIGFLSTIVVTRLFGSTTFGSLRLGMSVMAIGLLIATNGLSQGVINFIGRSENKEEALNIYVSGMVMGVVISSIIGSAMYFFANNISNVVFGSENPVVFIRFLGITLPFAAAYRLTLAATRGWNYSGPTNIFGNVIFPLGKLLLFTSVVTLGYGKRGLAISLTILYICMALFSIVIIKYYIIVKIQFEKIAEFLPKHDVYTRLFSYSYPLVLSGSAWFLMTNADTFLIGYYLTDSAVGQYSVAFSVALLFTIVNTAIGMLFLPNISSLHSNDQMNELQTVYTKTTKWMIVLLFPIFIIVVGFPNAILDMFGREFRSAADTLVVLAVGLSSQVVLGLNGDTLKGIGEVRWIFYNVLIALILDIILNIILIPEFGIIGAAIATSVSYVLSNILHSAYLARQYDILPGKRSFFVVSAIAFLIAVATPYVGFPQENIYMGIVYSAATSILYIILLYQSGYISYKEINRIILEIRQIFGGQYR